MGSKLGPTFWNLEVRGYTRPSDRVQRSNFVEILAYGPAALIDFSAYGQCVEVR